VCDKVLTCLNFFSLLLKPSTLHKLWEKFSSLLFNACHCTVKLCQCTALFCFLEESFRYVDIRDGAYCLIVLKKRNFFVTSKITYLSHCNNRRRAGSPRLDSRKEQEFSFRDRTRIFFPTKRGHAGTGSGGHTAPACSSKQLLTMTYFSN